MTLSLANPELLSVYLVLDPDLCGGADGMIRTALEAARGGCSIVQLRAPLWKKRAIAECARELVHALAPLHVPLIIDDHADVAFAAGAAGVHVGQKDLSPEDCRRLLGPEAIIGLSVSNAAELEKSRASVLAGAADYLGIGPVAATASKKDAAAPLGIDGFQRLAAVKPCPAVAIGSVKQENAAALRAAGADGVAVISAICGQKDPRTAAQALKAAFLS